MGLVMGTDVQFQCGLWLGYCFCAYSARPFNCAKKWGGGGGGGEDSEGIVHVCTFVCTYLHAYVYITLYIRMYCICALYLCSVWCCVYCHSETTAHLMGVLGVLSDHITEQ